jgi:ABC-type amino acid transport substrate-binding protein
LKGLAAASVLGLAALCARLAPARGVDPRTAAAFVALNPLVLVHVVGGAHNDALMMLLVMLGVAGVLALAEVSAGAALVGGVAVKVSAAFAAPFALLGAKRRGRLIAGAAVGAALCVAVSLAAFGSHALDAVGLVGENQAATSHYSIPATSARVLGIDVDAVRLVALLLYAGSVVLLLRWAWRGGDWLRAAGWAGFGLLLASGWLLPWYLIWALPLAALARDRALGGALLALTAFQLVNRVPL